MVCVHYKTIVFIFLFLISAIYYPYSILTNTNLFFGVLLLVYFVSQIVFAIQNYYSMKYLSLPDIGCPPVAFMIVGYRENPDYWRKCLQSILSVDYPHVSTISAFIDGDENDDLYMDDIFKDVIREYNETGRPCHSGVHLLKHRGKRHAMSDGIRAIRQAFPENPYIIVIDSDTILTKDCVRHLVSSLHAHPDTGCATGNIQIFNTDRWLARIINARYLYAFTIERSAMSAVGVMNCCSGPFSIYRQELLDDDFLEDFENQTFCGKKVGPGDDRHATLLILNKGYKARQNPFAIVYTETPDTFHRYLQQQLRWMRSFYREQFWQIRAIPRQNIYLAFLTTYEILFPLLILFSFFPTFRLIDVNINNTIFYQRVVISVGILLFRCFLLLCFNKFNPSCLWNLCVFPIYFILLLPLKIYAVTTVGVQSWITSSRKTILSHINPDTIMIYVSILLWNLILIFCASHLILPLPSLHIPDSWKKYLTPPFLS